MKPGSCGAVGLNLGRWAEKEQVLDRSVGLLEQNKNIFCASYVNATAKSIYKTSSSKDSCIHPS